MKSHTSKRGAQGALVKFFTAAAIMAGLAAVQQANAAGIADSKHNLGATGTNANHLVGTASKEICVFCHTPHASSTAITAPLWNKPKSSATYTLYDAAYSPSMQAGSDMTGMSLACLSCHDGTQAMDTVINAPGSGFGSGRMAADADWVGATGGKLTTGIAALSTDLTNDHPVGIQYCGGGKTLAATTNATVSGTCKDPDFNAISSALVGGKAVLWVELATVAGIVAPGSGTARDRTDMQLYVRNVQSTTDTAAAIQPFVECGSCHDPHTTANPTFLRATNDGSRVCLSCHNK